MLSNWQLIVLNNGLWLMPLLGAIVLARFPWRHWNTIIDEGTMK